MDIPWVVLPVHCFQIELKFVMLVTAERRKLEDPQRNPRSKDENQRQPPGIEPGSQR